MGFVLMNAYCPCACLCSGLRGELAYCKLLSALLDGTRHVKLQSNAASIVAAALRLWVNPVHDTAEGAAPPCAAVLQQAALGVFGQFLQENFQHVAEHERAALIAVLLSLAQPPDCVPNPSPAPANSGPNASAASQQQSELAHGMEVQRLALHALSCCYGATHGAGLASKGLPADAVTQLQACVVASLQLCCTGRARIVETHMHSRYYATLLRTLAVVITEGRKGWVPQAAVLVECLRKFLRYGVQNGPTTASSAVSVSQADGAGQPPTSPSGSGVLASSLFALFAFQCIDTWQIPP